MRQSALARVRAPQPLTPPFLKGTLNLAVYSIHSPTFISVLRRNKASSMSTLYRTLRNLRRIGFKEFGHQLQNIGDTKAGTFIAADRYGNKYYENLKEELPRMSLSSLSYLSSISFLPMGATNKGVWAGYIYTAWVNATGGGR